MDRSSNCCFVSCKIFLKVIFQKKIFSEKPLDDFLSVLSADNSDLISAQSLSLLHIICAGHNEKQAEKLQKTLQILSDKKSTLSLISANGFTALHIAIYKGDVAIVKVLIGGGVDLDQSGRHQLPPLHLAAMIGDSDMISVLLEAGANVHSTDFVHFTALHCATYFGQEAVTYTFLKSLKFAKFQAVRLLLTHNANANLGGAVNDRPIHLASAKGLTAITKLLLDAGADREFKTF